jgi:hypothetical protein
MPLETTAEGAAEVVVTAARRCVVVDVGAGTVVVVVVVGEVLDDVVDGVVVDVTIDAPVSVGWSDFEPATAKPTATRPTTSATVTQTRLGRRLPSPIT